MPCMSWASCQAKDGCVVLVRVLSRNTMHYKTRITHRNPACRVLIYLMDKDSSGFSRGQIHVCWFVGGL